MNSSKLFSLFLALTALSGQTVCPKPQDRTAYLNSINALTFHPIPQSITHKSTSIEELVQTIYRTDRVPERTNLEINGKPYIAQRGITLSPNDHTVFIFSRGYAFHKKPTPSDYFIQRGSCALAGYLQYENHIVTDCPVISFDYDDSREGFTFGQDNDLATLKAVYESVLQQNPNINIVLIGDCRGSKVALELATQKPNNLKALILLSPFMYAPELIHQLAKSYHIPDRLLHGVLNRYCINYDPQKETLPDRLDQIDTNLPIFIGQRKNDVLIPNKPIREFVKTVRKLGNKKVHGLIVVDSTERHSKVYLNKKIQHRINKFLCKYNLPYSAVC